METRRGRKKRSVAFDFDVEDVSICEANRSEKKLKKPQKENVPVETNLRDHTPVVIRKSSRKKKSSDEEVPETRKILNPKRRLGRKRKEPCDNEVPLVENSKKRYSYELDNTGNDILQSGSVENPNQTDGNKNNGKKRRTYELEETINDVKLLPRESPPKKERKSSTFEVASNDAKIEENKKGTIKKRSIRKLEDETFPSVNYELEKMTNDETQEIRKINSTFEISSHDAGLMENRKSIRVEEREEPIPIGGAIRKKYSARKSQVKFELPEDSPKREKKRNTYELESTVNNITTLRSNSFFEADQNVSTKTEKKRNTYELETTVNNITTLRSNSLFEADQNDSTLPQLTLTPINNGKRRGTYEIEKSLNDIEVNELNQPKRKKNSTFEITSSDSYLLQTSAHTSKTQNKNLLSSILNGKSTKKSEVTFKLPVKERSPRVLPKSAKKLLSSTPISKLKIASTGKLKSSEKPSSSVKKVPNFEAIHKKELEHRENLNEYLIRKNERAKALLSGSKVKIGQDNKTSSENQSKKRLAFPEIQMKNVSSQNRKLLSPKNPKSQDFKKVVASPVIKKQQLNKPNVKNTLKNPLNIANKLVGSGYTQFGFKLNKDLKEAKTEIKVMATKTKIQKERVENRCQIKGVRSNRRFDLIMNMRLKKN